METVKQFRDVQFMAASEKQCVLRQWVRFIKSGFDERHFMKSLYKHLIQHCSFIAQLLWGAPHKKCYGESRFMLTLRPPSSCALARV